MDSMKGTINQNDLTKDDLTNNPITTKNIHNDYQKKTIFSGFSRTCYGGPFTS